MSWAYKLKPRERELLSSFITRVAHAHSTSPAAFCRLHLGDGWYWTRDVDRGVALKHHNPLSRLSGLPLGALKTLTLRDWVDALKPSTDSQSASLAVVPWINASGVYQTRRTLRALQFCPECLLENPCAQKQWRLVFHTQCDKHQRPLKDMCSYCSAPFVPHLSLNTIIRCYCCGNSLLNRGEPAWGDEVEKAAVNIQRRLSVWLDRAVTGDQSAKDDLFSARTLLSVCLHRHVGDLVVAPLIENFSERIYGRVEFWGIEQRTSAMAWLNWTLENWPSSFRRIAERAGLTQRSFVRARARSNWLLEEIEAIPPGQKRRRVKMIEELRLPLVELARTRPDNWRSTRAGWLMRGLSKRGH